MSGERELSWTPPGNPWFVAIVATLGAFMEVLDTTIVNVSLPHIAGSLAVSTDDSSWAITTYLVANGIVLTISGALSRRFGRKSYFLLCIAGFTATSFACGSSTSFSELLIFRALQGLFGGGLQPTQQAIILDYFPPAKRQAAFSLTAVAIIVAPIFGPVIGGYLTDQYSWNWIFLVNVPIGLITFFGILHQVEDSPQVQKDKSTAPPFDYIGFLFVVFALGCLELGVDRGENYDWLGSVFIRTAFAVSGMSFLLGIPYLIHARQPVVNLRAFKDRNFTLATMEIAIMGFVMYASAVLIPQFAQQQLSYTATWAGLVLAPGGVILVALIPVAGRVMKFVPVKYVIAAGGVALGASLLLSRQLIPNLDYFHLAEYRAAQSAALALLFVPISAIAYTTIPPALSNDATALFSMARNVFGGLGISISTAIIAEHQQIWQAHLVGHLTPVSQPYDVLLQQIRSTLMRLGHSSTQAAHTASDQVFQMLQTQIAVLSYKDTFLITAMLAFATIPLALLMTSEKSKGSGGVH